MLREALLISVGQLVLCTFCGLGLALWLPPSRIAHRLLLAPAFGLALLAVFGLYGSVAGFTLRQILPLVLCLSLGILIAVLRQPECRRVELPPPLEAGALVGLALLSWLLAMAPALAKARLMPFGYGMDVEFYLGLAAYLKDYSYRSLAQAPVGPIRDLISNEYLSQIAFGSAYAQGMSDLVGGWEAWRSWVPWQASLRVIASLSLYVLLRSSLALPTRGALLGVFLVSLNSLLLWLSYNNFSASLAGAAVLPAALALTLPSLEHDERRTLLLASLLIGGLTCLYWPMLTAFGALGAGLGCAVLATRQAPIKVVGRGVALLGLGALVGLLPNLRAQQAFPGLFSATTAYMGIDFFIPPTLIAGVAPLAYPDPITVTPVGAIMGWLGLGALAVALLSIVSTERGARRPILGLSVAALLYLIGLRWIVAYPYGYFRGTSYVVPILLGLAGAGLANLIWPGRTTPAAPSRPLIGMLRPGLGLLLGVITLGSMIAATRSTAQSYAAAPSGYPPAADRLDQLVASLREPGAIYVSSAAANSLCGNHQGAWAYWLRDRDMLGHVRATFATSVNPRTSAMPAYGILLNTEDPAAHGLAASPVWQTELLSVYPAPSGMLAWLSGLDRYSVPPACALESSNRARAELGLGNFQRAQPDQPLQIFGSASELAWTPLDLPGASAQRGVQLSLISPLTQTLQLALGSDARTITLPAGLSHYQSGPITVPLQLQLTPLDAPILVPAVSLHDPASPVGLERASAHLVLEIASTTEASGLDVALRTHNQSGQALRLAIEIYEEIYGYEGTPVRYAGGNLALPADGLHQLSVDLQAPTATLNGQPITLDAAPRDGTYFVALWVYQGEQVRRQVPLASFTRQAGQIEALTLAATNAVIVPIGAPAQALEVTTQEGPSLRGFELDQTTVQIGQDLRVALLWETPQAIPATYLVFVQLLDAQDTKAAQWDGYAGGAWMPTHTWQPTQRIWQDVPLQIAPDAAPGTYRIVTGLYDPNTGTRLMLSSGGDMLSLAEVTLTP